MPRPRLYNAGMAVAVAQRLDPREDALSKPYPPLGTLQAAAVAQQAGAEVRFYDPMFAADESAFAAVLDEEPVDAVAPGQAAVVYRDTQVIGGGWSDGGAKEIPMDNSTTSG